jgi:hypothetical protein
MIAIVQEFTTGIPEYDSMIFFIKENKTPTFRWGLSLSLKFLNSLDI